MVARANQLTGGKAQSAKNAMELMPEDSQQSRIASISKFAWESCPWTEEALSS